MAQSIGYLWEHQVLPRLTVDDIYSGVKFKRQSAREFRAPCPLHGGANKTSFKVDPRNLRYHCFSGCGPGGPLEFLNGGARPEGAKFAELVLGLANRVGVDTSDFTSGRPAPKLRPRPIRKIEPPKRPDVRDLTGILGDAIGKGTRESLEWLRSRVPGVSDEDLSVLLEDQLIGNPALSKDIGEHGGAHELGRRGWRHMTILWSMDRPGIPSSAQLRWTGTNGDRGSRPKTLMMTGSPGGKHGATFGRIDRVIDAACHTGIIYVTEGDADFALIRALNFRNAIGVPGAMEAAKVAAYLRDKEWEGRLVLALDADAAGDAAAEKVAKMLEKTDGIEVLRARPPKDGEDLNDVWLRAYRDHRESIGDDKLNPLIGGGEAARAVVAVLESAKVLKPTRGFDAKHPEHEEAIREYFEEISRTPEEIRKLRIDSIRQNTEAMAKRSPPKNLDRLRRIVRDLYRGAKDENKDALRKVLASILVHPFTGIGEEAAAIAISDTFPGPAETTKRKPKKAIAAALEDWPDEDDGAAFRRWGRELVELTSGDGFLGFAVAVAESASLPVLEYLRRLGLTHGIQAKDKHQVRFRTVRDGQFLNDPRAKKLRGMTECGEMVIQNRLRSSGEIVRRKRTRCNCAECAFCQASYIGELAHFLRLRHQWGDRVVVGFVRAAEDSPEAAKAAWESGRDALPRYSVPDLMGFLHPSCPGFGLAAGALLVAPATDLSEDAMRHCSALGDVQTLPADIAIEMVSRSQTARALRVMAAVSRDSDELLEERWLDRMQTHRKRGEGLPWMASHAWLDFRKELAGEGGVDNRPQTVEYIHDRSGVLVHEHDATEMPKLHHELVRLCSESPAVQAFLRTERHELLPFSAAHALDLASSARANRRALF